ncbi:VOC family protein [Fulvivirgaceae bacterium BMA10]|uniref:VOC family protein n=1 Tax=Splendidivirga corallicola TaxID=3051826 RepID=A0ABT8KVW5_9BACT|nr:VOC family protein [Fulvivirgaceae bacterium BMA10]
MNKLQNPFGLHTITPYLVVENVEQLIDFLKRVFKAELRGEINYRSDNSVQHAEIKIGDSVVMLGEPRPDFPEVTPMTCGMYLYVDDCDVVYERALKFGGHSISEPMNYPHGDRYAGIKDFAGNIWWIVTHIGK